MTQPEILKERTDGTFTGQDGRVVHPAVGNTEGDGSGDPKVLVTDRWGRQVLEPATLNDIRELLQLQLQQLEQINLALQLTL